MKKMLMLVLILGIASFAGAAVNIYLTNGQGQSEITLTPSTNATLYVWYTGQSPYQGGGGVQGFDLEADVTSGPGTIISGTIDANGRNTAYDGINMPGIMGGDIELMGARDDDGALNSGLLLPLATVYFHCDGEGLVNIALSDVFIVDQAWNRLDPQLGDVIYHGMIIHQIPEPATIALLCLGGLFLRKKK